MGYRSIAQKILAAGLCVGIAAAPGVGAINRDPGMGRADLASSIAGAVSLLPSQLQGIVLDALNAESPRIFNLGLSRLSDDDLQVDSSLPVDQANEMRIHGVGSFAAAVYDSGDPAHVRERAERIDRLKEALLASRSIPEESKPALEKLLSGVARTVRERRAAMIAENAADIAASLGRPGTPADGEVAGAPAGVGFSGATAHHQSTQLRRFAPAAGYEADPHVRLENEWLGSVGQELFSGIKNWPLRHVASVLAKKMLLTRPENSLEIYELIGFCVGNELAPLLDQMGNKYYDLDDLRAAHGSFDLAIELISTQYPVLAGIMSSISHGRSIHNIQERIAEWLELREGIHGEELLPVVQIKKTEEKFLN